MTLGLPLYMLNLLTVILTQLEMVIKRTIELLLDF